MFPKTGSSTSCGTEPGALCLGWICQSSQVHTFPWAAPSPWARSPRPETPWGGVPASPRIVENPGTNHAGFCVDCGASLMAEGEVLVSWHWQRVEEGMWRANQRQKDLLDPGSPGSKSPSDTVLSPGDTVLAAPLLWLSLLEICCRPLWVAHALRGPLVLPKGHGRAASV